MGGQLKVKYEENPCIYEYVIRIGDLHIGGFFQYLVSF